MHLEAPRCALRIVSQRPAPAQIPSEGPSIPCPSQRSHKMDTTAGGWVLICKALAGLCLRPITSQGRIALPLPLAKPLISLGFRGWPGSTPTGGECHGPPYR